MLSAIEIDFISRFATQFRSQTFAQQYIRGIIVWPHTLHSPPGMGDAHTGCKTFFAECKALGEIGSQKSEILRIGVVTHADAHGQHRRKTDDIVMPERTSDLRQVGFVQVCAIAGWLQVYTADLNVERVFLRSDDQVRAVVPQFTTDLVADICRNGDHGGCHAHTQSDGNACQNLAAFLPAKRFVDQASKHGYCWNMRLLAAMSASWMITASEVT